MRVLAPGAEVTGWLALVTTPHDWADAVGRPSRRGARCSSTRCGQRDAGTVEAHGALLPANEAEAVEPRGALLLNDNAAADSTNGHTTGQVYDAQDTTLLDLHERQQQGHGFIGTILASDPSLFGAMLYDTPSVEDPQTAPSGFIASALESDLSLLEGVPNSRLAPGQDPLVEDTNAQGHMEVISWADACASEARRGTWDGIPATVQILLAQNLEDALDDALLSAPGSDRTPADDTLVAVAPHPAAQPLADAPSHGTGDMPGHSTGARRPARVLAMGLAVMQGQPSSTT